jgi:aldehyde:ferredoxin oxidoreductase
MAEKRKFSARNGFWGRICTVDLSSRDIRFEEVGEEVYRKWLGGVGLGAKMLWDRIKPGIDPMGPENVLGFTTGLLTDTGSVFTGRFTVVTKSPLTGGWGDANCGGYFSPFLKRCRIDALFVSGTADRPVYLYLDENTADIRDASDLWGQDTIQTETELKSRHGKGAQVACIGPAGERRSFIASISTDGGRMAARSGVGGVMGAKKLKAVVAVGKARIGVADKAAVTRLTEGFRGRIKSFGFLKPLLRDRVLAMAGRLTGKPVFLRQPAVLWRWLLKKYGTPSLTAICAETGDSPIKNWSGDIVADFPPERYRKISGDAVIKYETKKYGCYSCPIRCGGTVKMDEGPHILEKMHKPEYETICAVGNLLLNDDLPAIFRLNDMLNRGGIDSIACGGVLAFAIECFTEGIIDRDDTGGLDLTWGNTEAITKLTTMIVYREGIGDIFADGVKLAAERLGKGSEKYAIHCGGVEAPMHDAKLDPGLGMTYYCEPTPGRHTISSLQFLEVQSLEKQFSKAKPVPLFSSHGARYRCDDKGEAIAVGSCYKMLVDAAGACLFGTQVGGGLPLCEWMNAVTGWNRSNDEYLACGERIEQIRHAFNVREGLNPVRDFRPHPRIYGDPPLTRGPLKGVKLDMDALAQSFYAAMGWDIRTGRPEFSRLQALDLTEVIEAFYPEGHDTDERSVE